MFKNDDQKKNMKQDIETIIGQSVKLDGDFVGEGDIIVEGIVNGNIKTKKYLRIGEFAQINAEIEAGDAFIAGVVNGNIKVDNKLEITSTAKIKGDLETSLLSVETGALINGKCQMKESKLRQNDSEVEKPQLV
jgi:cytoskeletal protein CcmA (bactofilin family)